MAKKRMLSNEIIGSDAFVEMPLSAQALYCHLNTNADDDGFINCPKRIQRIIGANDDDMKILLAKGFIIAFRSGVVVETHWKINNYIRSDRYTPTRYTDEKSHLICEKNGTYSIDFNDNALVGIPSGSIDKISIDKNNTNKIYAHSENAREPESVTSQDIEPEYEKVFSELWVIYPRKKGKGQVKPAQKKKIAQIGIEEMTRAIERYQQHIRTHDISIEHVQYGSTFFNSGYVDYLDENYQPEKKSIKANSFNNFLSRNDYDYEKMQREAIENATRKP